LNFYVLQKVRANLAFDGQFLTSWFNFVNFDLLLWVVDNISLLLCTHGRRFWCDLIWFSI